MRDLVLEQVRGLAAALAALEARVRAAVAGEVSRVVAEAVGEVLAVALGGRPAGRPGRYGACPGGPPAGYGRDPWDDDWADDDGRCSRPAWAGAGPGDRPDRARGTPLDPAVAAALVLAVTLGRCWGAGRGTRWGAAGLGLAAAGAALAGGPLVHGALGVFWAAHRLLAATDALGDGARALDRF